MRSIIVIAAASMILGSLVPLASAADDVSGVITGYVQIGGRPAPGVKVYAYSERSPVVIRTADPHGFFAFLGLLPGTYQMVAKTRGARGRTCPGKLVLVPGMYRRITITLYRNSTVVDCLTPFVEPAIMY